jgi:hypothetical protein
MRRLARDEERERHISMEMASQEECQHEMFVLTRWERGTLAVPLAQLEGIGVDEQTRQVIEDWQYWAARYDL